MSDSDKGVVIDGERYDIPTIDTFTLDEAEIFHGYTGWVIEDFVPPNPEAPVEVRAEHWAELNRKMRHPSFALAYMHIAYRRGNEDASPDHIRKLIGRVPVLDAIVAIYGNDSEDPTKDSPTVPESQSRSGTLSSSEGSGSPSLSVSDLRDVGDETTGTGGSGMSSPVSLLAGRAS